MLIQYLNKIPDHRRGQGRMFDLPHMLLFSIIAIASGADSYRTIATFIEENFDKLNNHFNTKWKRSPSYNSVRHIIHNLDQGEVEKVFRKYSKDILKLDVRGKNVISLDGKFLKHSFNNIHDQDFKQMLSAFSVDTDIILAHEDVKSKKTNEINSLNKLLKELKIDNVVYVVDALHTQKKR